MTNDEFFVDDDDAVNAVKRAVKVRVIAAAAPKQTRRRPARYVVFATPLNGDKLYTLKTFNITPEADRLTQERAAYDLAAQHSATYPERCDVVYYGGR